MLLVNYRACACVCVCVKSQHSRMLQEACFQMKATIFERERKWPHVWGWHPRPSGYVFAAWPVGLARQSYSPFTFLAMSLLHSLGESGTYSIRVEQHCGLHLFLNACFLPLLVINIFPRERRRFAATRPHLRDGMKQYQRPLSIAQLCFLAVA